MNAKKAGGLTGRGRAGQEVREPLHLDRILFEANPIALITIDLAGGISDSNNAAGEMTYCSREDLAGRKASSLFQDPEKARAWLRHVLSQGLVRGYELGLRRSDGTIVPVACDAGVVYGGTDGEPTGVIVAIQDATESKRAEEALRWGEERFNRLLQNASEVITVLEADGSVLYESPAAERVLGYRPEELVGKNFFDYVHPDDTARVSRAFTGSSGEPEAVPPVVEYRFRHADGSWRHVEASGNNLLDDPNVEGIVVNSRDVTERKELEERLAHQAVYDPLTGLSNRTLFMERLGRALALAKRGKRQVAVLFLDLDNFKVVNDSLEYEMGDRLLVAMADRLKKCLRAEDTLARLGGDEFGILLETVRDEGEAIRVAQRVSEELRGPYLLGGHEVFVTTSVGVALGASGEDRHEDLLRQADTAMYEAKGKGKARYEVFDPSMDALALERLNVGNDLRRAIEREEFEVRYQPKASLENGKIVGVEALVRWRHPERGLVYPEQFIPIAEETGLILPIGRCVLEEACRQARAWHDRRSGSADPPLSMCVNLSARQLEHPDLVSDVAKALEETGLDPRWLDLEITESVVMEDAELTIGTLRELKALGVRLVIDDFGTGYSSLAYLKRFPIDVLKIDRSFVSGLGEDSEDTVLVSGIISLAHALGLEVIAEGVEDAEQLTRLKGMGCDFAQGYYFAEPLPGEEIDKLLVCEQATKS